MKHAWGIPIVLLLAACTSAPPERDPKTRPPMGGGDVKDHVMPLNAAEPPWRDLIRHTVLPPPGKAMHPAPSLDGAFFAYATTEFGPKLQIAMRETFDASPMQLTSNWSLASRRTGSTSHTRPTGTATGTSTSLASTRPAASRR
jgi:hypothetical protein